MPQWTLLGTSCGDWGAAGFAGLWQFHNLLKGWRGSRGQGRAPSSAQPASSMPHKPCVVLFLFLMNPSVGTGSRTPEGGRVCRREGSVTPPNGQEDTPLQLVTAGFPPAGGLRGPGHQEGLGVGIWVGDHLAGPAAAKRCLCCSERLGHTQRKAPIPKRHAVWGCVPVWKMEGRGLSRRNRERRTSVGAPGQAGLGHLKGGPGFLFGPLLGMLWTRHVQLLSSPGGPVGLQGQRQGAQPHCQELVAGGPLRRHTWALRSSPTPWS